MSLRLLDQKLFIGQRNTWKTLHTIHVGMLIGVENQNGKTKIISLEG